MAVVVVGTTPSSIGSLGPNTAKAGDTSKTCPLHLRGTMSTPESTTIITTAAVVATMGAEGTSVITNSEPTMDPHRSNHGAHTTHRRSRTVVMEATPDFETLYSFC